MQREETDDYEQQWNDDQQGKWDKLGGKPTPLRLCTGQIDGDVATECIYYAVRQS